MTTISVELWQLLAFLAGLLLSFFGAVFAGGRLLLSQVERRLDEQFAAQDEQRRQNQKHMDTKFAALEKAAEDEAQEWRKIEREVMSLKADLPINYVRREDYIRNQSVIEAKLDGLALRIENALLKGERNA
jgi:uncharacterized membrane-anchored protein YhcB (DUF1043 family)